MTFLYNDLTLLKTTKSFLLWTLTNLKWKTILVYSIGLPRTLVSQLMNVSRFKHRQSYAQRSFIVVCTVLYMFKKPFWIILQKSLNMKTLNLYYCCFALRWLPLIKEHLTCEHSSSFPRKYFILFKIVIDLHCWVVIVQRNGVLVFCETTN